jgi:hypothetical protein
MPFLSLRITPPARLIQKRFENLRRKIPVISRKRMYDAAVAIRHEMKQPGAKPNGPIPWDSPKQQKAFFATDGFGRGIPTKRGGEYIRGWQILRIENGYDVGNPLAHARYIGGTARSTNRQSRIHRGRWNLFKVVKDKVLAKLPKAVKEALQQLARQEGFRTK